MASISNVTSSNDANYNSQNNRTTTETTKGAEFNIWTDNVAREDIGAGDFVAINSNTKTTEEYQKDLEQMAEEYIQLYDTDGDGAINLKEFLTKELNQMLEEFGDQIDQDNFNTMGRQLKNIFDNLNVDKTENSAKTLDAKEIANYFYTMDFLNYKNDENNTENHSFQPDGVITATEYKLMTDALAIDGKEEGSLGANMNTLLKFNFSQKYKQ